MSGRMLIGVVWGERSSIGREGVGYGTRAAWLGVGGRRRLRWRDGYVGGECCGMPTKQWCQGPAIRLRCLCYSRRVTVKSVDAPR